MRNSATTQERGESLKSQWGFVWQVLLVLIAFGAAGFGITEVSKITFYQKMFDEMMGGKPLPLITQWVFQYRALLVMAACFVPCAALATFALRERWQALGSLIFLSFMGACVGLTVKVALAVPMMVTMKQMGAQ